MDTSATMPEVPGAMTAGELVGHVALHHHVARLADGGARDAGVDGAGEDRGREDEADDRAADGAPQEAVAGLVVGHLLDVDLALVVGVGDQDAVDVERPLDLGVDQRVVGRSWPSPCRRTAPR